MPKFKKDISSQTKLPLLVGVVMGPKGSGKSAIVKALHKSDLSGWTKPDPTHFYLVTPKRRAKIQLWYVNLSLNETGKALAWLHANSAQLVFLVLDVERLKSDKVRELEQYREFFLNLSLKNKPTILVINKMDLLKSDAERAILCEKAHQLAEELSVEDTIFCSALPERGSAIRESGIQEIFDCLDMSEAVRQDFHEAKRLIKRHFAIKNEFNFLKNSDKSTPAYKLYKGIGKLWQKVKEELNNEVDQLMVAKAVKELAENLPQLSSEHIKKFHQATKQFRVKPGWHEILSAIVGALVGIAVGAGIGAALGFAGIVPLIAGAAVGASLVVVGAPLGGWGSFWYRREHDPINQIEKNAKKIEMNQKKVLKHI